MNCKPLLLPVFLLASLFVHAQDATKTHRLKHSPLGITAELPSLYQMNFKALNACDTLHVNAHNWDYTFGVHFYLGVRDKFFVSYGFAFRPKYSTNAIGNSKVDFLMYAPLYKKNKTTLFVSAGITNSKTQLKLWRYEGLSGSLLTDYQIKQNWNLNLGLMYDFAENNFGISCISEAIKIGYNIPLTKAQWYMGDTKINNAPSVNLGGFYASFVINYF